MTKEEINDLIEYLTDNLIKDEVILARMEKEFIIEALENYKEIIF